MSLGKCLLDILLNLCGYLHSNKIVERLGLPLVSWWRLSAEVSIRSLGSLKQWWVCSFYLFYLLCYLLIYLLFIYFICYCYLFLFRVLFISGSQSIRPEVRVSILNCHFLSSWFDNSAILQYYNSEILLLMIKMISKFKKIILIHLINLINTRIFEIYVLNIFIVEKEKQSCFLLISGPLANEKSGNHPYLWYFGHWVGFWLLLLSMLPTLWALILCRPIYL